MHYKLSLSVLALISSQAYAQDWTATVGQQRRTVDFSLPGNSYKSTSDITTASAFRQVTPGMYAGGSLSYSTSVTDIRSITGQVKSSAGTGSVFVLYSLQPTLFVDANVGYGNVVLDNAFLAAGNRVTYTGKTDLLIAGAGLTKAYALTPSLTSTLSARYTHTKSMSKSYTTSAGVTTPDSDRAFGFVTLGGGLSWRLGSWEPSARVSYNRGNKSFDVGAHDKDYFSYSLGAGYAFTPSTKLSLSYSGVSGKSFAKENALQLSLRTAF
jgi:Autotransporter beta-domain